MGKKNNQEFVQIPTAKLKNRIQQLCEEIGIQFVETEESYTDRSSFLDNDFLPIYGAKPKSWKSSGKRGKKGDGIGRGQYKTAQNILINSLTPSVPPKLLLSPPMPKLSAAALGQLWLVSLQHP